MITTLYIIQSKKIHFVFNLLFVVTKKEKLVLNGKRQLENRPIVTVVAQVTCDVTAPRSFVVRHCGSIGW